MKSCKGTVEKADTFLPLEIHLQKVASGQQVYVMRVSLATVYDSCLLSFLYGPLKRVWLLLLYNLPLD